ncbi:MAG: PLP-dependent lyase/thiolase [Candidatus Paceibacterota bacterium]|jgi:threonine dehydratase
MITPQKDSPELAKALSIAKIVLKREDLHPYGSHKGRSIPRMIDHYADLGRARFAITGSGNAALAAARHIKRCNSSGAKLSLDVFVGENIDKDKLGLLEKESSGDVRIARAERPLQKLLEMTRLSNVISLRQSTDDEALVGYYELAEELLAIRDLDAVFMATSSGTTIQGLGELFLREGRNIRLFAVQTTSCHPIADGFDATDSEERSIAGAIVDKVAKRRGAVSKLLRSSGGGAYIAANADIREAQAMLKVQADIDTTGNGALSLAGLKKALSKGLSFHGTVVCIIGGR